MLKWIKNVFSHSESPASAESAQVQAQQRPQSAEQEKARGDASMQQGNFAQAVVHYRAALVLQPDFAGAHKLLGFALQELGMATEAEQSLQLALQYDSKLADAHYGLAAIAQTRGDLDAAIGCYRQALEIAPDFDVAYRDLAFLLFRLGRLDDAIAVVSMGVQHCLNQADLHLILGNLHHERGQYPQAIASLRAAEALQPDSVEVLTNLGIVLYKSDELEQAADVLQRALLHHAHHGGLTDVYNTLGLVLHKLERYEEALAIYQRGLAVDPLAAILHGNLGYTLQAMQRLEDAVAAYNTALTFDPMAQTTWLNLGNALQQQRDMQGAIASYRQSLLIEPDSKLSWNNLGNVLGELSEINASIRCYQHALAIDPAFADAHNNLGNLHMTLGRFEEAVESFREAMRHDPDHIAARSNLLFTYNFLHGVTPQQVLEEARNFGAVAQSKARPYSTWPNTRERERCLCVGIVSGDLFNKAVGFFAEGVLTRLAAQSAGRLQLIAYHNHRMHDELSERIKPSFAQWHVTVGLSDAMLAQQIRDDGIDILIDLSGHTVNNRLTMFAWKPAPVQLSWLGYFATTGVAEIDYLIGDEWTLPVELGSHFSETIWRVPHTRLCFTEPVADVAVSSLPALANGYITFGCFNSLAKMTDDVVALWARVLAAVPNSRLFLKAAQLLTADMQQHTSQRFVAHGIDTDRLILEGPSPRGQYLAAYQRIDIALDPFPYTGGTTSAESLWMGVPVLTLSGDRFLSRQGIGLLMNAGLPEWIAQDQDDYVVRAKALSSDLSQLSALRACLRQQVLASPIFDGAAFANNLEKALRAMWIKWCDANP